MGKKFSRVLGGARYKTELDNYIKWLTGEAERQPNIGKKGNRPASKKLYIIPFGYSLPSTVHLTQSASLTIWDTHKSDFSAYTLDTLPTDNNALKIRGYRAPRVTIITGLADAGSVKTSHITGAKYLSYGGKSASIPFGKGSTTKSENDVFTTIKSSDTFTNVRLYLVPEQI